MRNVLLYLWQHPALFWPLVSIAYFMIGTMLSLRLYWRYCRHQRLEHHWKGGGFEHPCGCWCNPNDVPGGFYLFGAYSSPILWPVILAVILAVIFISFPIRVLMTFFKRIERRACWDGKTVEGSHPTAKPFERLETVEEELVRRTGEGPDIEI